MKIRLFGLALVPMLAAPPVFAQQEVSAQTDNDGTAHGVATNSTTGGDADAAYKRWAVVGSATMLQPSSRPLDGTSLDVDGDTAPTISASWYATPNIAVELWGAVDKFKHDVTDNAGKVGRSTSCLWRSVASITSARQIRCSVRSWVWATTSPISAMRRWAACPARTLAWRMPRVPSARWAWT